MDMSRSDLNVGFIGLGAMGYPMTKNLAEKLPNDAHIYVYDVVTSFIDRMCSEFPEKVFKCSDAKHVADKSDVIFTMLPEGKHVNSVYLDTPTGICSGQLSNKLLVDCSTIDTATCVLVKEHFAKNFPTASFYDAPVSGGVIGAQRGTLAFFLGCDSQDRNSERLTRLLGLMGKNIIQCGGPSLGLVAKLSNNYLAGVIGIACSEAMDMGMKSGLDPRILAKVFAAGTAQCTGSDKFNPVPGVVPEATSSHGYAPGFKVQLMRKDVALAMDMAGRAGCHNVLGDVTLKTYDNTSKDPRCKDLDSKVVYRFLGGNENWQQNVGR